MLKQGYHNLAQPRFPIIFCTKSSVYFLDNSAMPQVLTCGKGNVIPNNKQQ